MALRLDNVLIVVEDLERVKSFFLALGMELVGETLVEGPWFGSVVGLEDVRADIVMLGTPDGKCRIELSRFENPPAVRIEPEDAPANALGLRRVMFAVDDVDAVVDQICELDAELVGEIAQYEDSYRLCFVRGPEGILVGLAQELDRR